MYVQGKEVQSYFLLSIGCQFHTFVVEDHITEFITLYIVQKYPYRRVSVPFISALPFIFKLHSVLMYFNLISFSFCSIILFINPQLYLQHNIFIRMWIIWLEPNA